MTRAFSIGAAGLTFLVGIIIISAAYGSDDPWGAFEWALAAAALSVLVAFGAAAGAAFAWILRRMFRS